MDNQRFTRISFVCSYGPIWMSTVPLSTIEWRGFTHVYELSNLRGHKLKVIMIYWVLVELEWWEYIYEIVSLISGIVPRGSGSVSGSPEGFRWISGNTGYYRLIICRWKMFPECWIIYKMVWNYLGQFYISFNINGPKKAKRWKATWATRAQVGRGAPSLRKKGE